MDLERFSGLIERLEVRSRERPLLYRAQVAALAALGYGYILALIALLLAVTASLIYAALEHGDSLLPYQLAIPAVAFAILLLRSLWIRTPAPTGIVLSPERVPRLFTAIERVRKTLGAPRVRHVLLDGDFNAGVTQLPLFGIIGPSANDLTLGLPLLQALSPDEFEATLAHELGHVSGKHGHFSHWIYRLRGTWHQLDEIGSDPGAGVYRVVLGRFAAWYAPFFNAYSFVLARQHEYEADRASAQIAGRSAAAAALIRLEVLSHLHRDYWEAVSRDVRLGIGVTAPCAGFVRALAQGLPQSDADRWLAQALRRPTDLGDSHPALSERLGAIGADDLRLPPPPKESAAVTLLGESASTLAAELDAEWWAGVEPQVAMVRAGREAAMQRLRELDAVPSSPETGWERVQLLSLLDRDVEAYAAADALLVEQPEHPHALLFRGASRLDADDEAGITILERAAHLYRFEAAAAHERIFNYYWRHGRREEAERARAALHDAAEWREKVMRWRHSLDPEPDFERHEVPSATIKRWRRVLAVVPGVQAVYLVRREDPHMSEEPCYFIGVVPEGSGSRQQREATNTQLLERVMHLIDWPPCTCGLIGDGPTAKLVRRMALYPGAVLFERSLSDSSASREPPFP